MEQISAELGKKLSQDEISTVTHFIQAQRGRRKIRVISIMLTHRVE